MTLVEYITIENETVTYRIFFQQELTFVVTQVVEFIMAAFVLSILLVFTTSKKKKKGRNNGVSSVSQEGHVPALLLM